MIQNPTFSLDDIPVQRKTAITPKFLVRNKQLKDLSVSDSAIHFQEQQRNASKKTEWKKLKRTTLAIPSNFFKNDGSFETKKECFDSKFHFDNSIFKPSTPSLPSFVPIVPRMWVAMGKQPTKEEICKSPEIYEDFNLFLQNQKEWKEKSLLDQLPFYAVAKEIKIQVCTWNINQGLYGQESVDKWTSLLSEKPDIIALGVQELDMSFDAIITGKKYSDRAEQWKNVICSSINRNGTYEYDESGWYQLCGTVLFVFVHKNIKSQIKMFGLSECRTGAMSGKLANKGGVAIGMKIFDSTICFVNSHLAAHQEFCERRNKDWEEISKMKIKYCNGESTQLISLLEHDVVIWLGDLNYRIDLEDSEVRKLVKEMDLTTLFNNDQLLNCRMKKMVFHNFNEAQITFLPTFKVKIGSGGYDENRIPSWCDRILFKTERRHGVVVEKYTSFELYNSDHKPVSAFMRVFLQQIDQDKKRIVQEFLDKAEPWYKSIVIPNLILSPMYMEFHNVNVFAEYAQEITITNTGRTRIHLLLNEKKEQKNFHEWAKIELRNEYVDIMEGRDTTKLKVIVNFDLHSAHLYQNKEACKFSFEIGIKYTKHTIPIVVEVFSHVTCIGMSLKQLSILEGPIKGTIKNTYTLPPYAIPKEIYRLVDKIISLNDEEIHSCLTDQPIQKNVQHVIEFLDMDSHFYGGINACCYFRALQIVLVGLQDSILHDNFIPFMKTYSDNPCFVRRYVVYMMDEAHRNVLIYIVKFLKCLINRGINKKMLIHSFGMVMIHKQKDDHQGQQYAEKILEILLNIF